jgi:hypothetical protein
VLFRSRWINSFEANNNSYTATVSVEPGPVRFEIEHWGKNPITDSNPDKFFELVDIKLNDLHCPMLLKDSLQHIKPTPWNPKLTTLPGNNYLGHNSTLVIAWSSPFNHWVQTNFDSRHCPIQGQETTREMLEQAKKFFKITNSKF